MKRLLFTYLLPVVPFCTVWDGVVSVLRLYTPDGMMQFAQGVDADGQYNWSVGRVRNPLGISIAYLVGCPATHIPNHL